MPVKLAPDFKFSYSAQEKFIEVAPGVSLNALHFHQADAKGAVLFFHGNAGNLASWGDVSKDFMPLGYDVFVIDYRGYGKSSGKISSEADLHSDAKIIYQHMLQNYPEEKIVIFGRSIGSGIAARLAAENNPRALILESPYFNLADVGKVHYPYLPVRLLLRYRFENDRYLPLVRCPILIIHGTEDEVIPYASGLKLKNLVSKVEMVTIAGGDHNNLSQFPEYSAALSRVLH